MKTRGGKRDGAGRKASVPTNTHPVRCTDEGWEWLQSQALSKGHTSVGKWADAAGCKAPKRKGNVPDQTPAALDSAMRQGAFSRLSASVLFVLGLSWWLLL